MDKKTVDLLGYAGISITAMNLIVLIFIEELSNLLFIGAFTIGTAFYYGLIILFIIPKRDEKMFSSTLGESISFSSKSKPEQRKKKAIPLSGKCRYCGKNTVMPYKCSYCGGIFCSEHRLPEKHNCDGTYKKR